MATLARTRDMIHDAMRNWTTVRRGNLSVCDVDDDTATGRLSGDDLGNWRKDRPLRAVYSYRTPVAWLTHTNAGEPVWRIVRERFSATTAHHIAVARMGAHYAGEPTV